MSIARALDLYSVLPPEQDGVRPKITQYPSCATCSLALRLHLIYALLLPHVSQPCSVCLQVWVLRGQLVSHAHRSHSSG